LEMKTGHVALGTSAWQDVCGNRASKDFF
jgi:hypothetical protein